MLAVSASDLALNGLVLSSAFVAAAQAAEAEQTATFDVPGMTCALCPVTVKKAMEAAEGVRNVKIDFDAKSATVVFDPSMTTVDAIAAASANAGYAAHPAGS